MSVQSWLNRIWYDRAAPPWWLLPLSLTYGAVAGSRRYLYVKHLRRSIRISSPVIVVGNLSVGGTGKTPLVCWLVCRLAETGLPARCGHPRLRRFLKERAADRADRRSRHRGG